MSMTRGVSRKLYARKLRVDLSFPILGRKRTLSSKDGSGLPKVPQNSAEPLGFRRKVLQNVSQGKKLVEERFCRTPPFLTPSSMFHLAISCLGANPLVNGRSFRWPILCLPESVFSLASSAVRGSGFSVTTEQAMSCTRALFPSHSLTIPCSVSTSTSLSLSFCLSISLYVSLHLSLSLCLNLSLSLSLSLCCWAVSHSLSLFLSLSLSLSPSLSLTVCLSVFVPVCLSLSSVFSSLSLHLSQTGLEQATHRVPAGVGCIWRMALRTVIFHRELSILLPQH